MCVSLVWLLTKDLIFSVTPSFVVDEAEVFSSVLLRPWDDPQTSASTLSRDKSVMLHNSSVLQGCFQYTNYEACRFAKIMEAAN